MSEADIQSALTRLEGWQFQDDSISRTFEFNSFKEAVSFIVRMAFEAEALDHHPEICNLYSRVHVALCTHDADNRVTEMDIELADRINHLSWI